MGKQYAILVPVLNEENNRYLEKNLSKFAQLTDLVDVLFIDGGSRDQTVEILRAGNWRVIVEPGTNRAERFNIGLEATKSELVLLHHPRSSVDMEGLQRFSQVRNEAWGGFYHAFDVAHPLLKFTSWYSNHVRAARGILYLDHCIYAPRAWLKAIGGVPNWDVFEDTELSLRLRSFARPQLLPYRSETSAIRFLKNGVIRQSILNQYLKCSYYLGGRHRDLNQRYEKGLELNGVSQK